MRPFLVEQAPRLKGDISLAGDKSIAHRSIILSAITRGKTVIKNFPANEDCLRTLEALKQLGAGISLKRAGRANTLIVSGKGLKGLRKPRGPVFIGDSGTSLRLILGVLAGQDFTVTLTAGKSLSRRPMRRVTEPLRLMGAVIRSRRRDTEEYPPITIRGGNLKSITYKMPVASAQVKSAILLAGLFAKGKTSVIEPVKTRDHTERMLKLFGAGIKARRGRITLKGDRELASPGIITIPADISSASFFIVLTVILPDSHLVIENVGLNPSRTGIIRVLRRMGADIRFSFSAARFPGDEPAGDIIVRSSNLKGTTVKEKEIPSLIDELPVLMAAGCFAKGKTIIKGAAELRVKETDRIRSMSWNLRRMGADIRVAKTAKSEQIIITGVKGLKGASVKSFGDHRTAMSMVVAGLKASGRTRIDDIACIDKSFPDFLNILRGLKLL